MASKSNCAAGGGLAAKVMGLRRSCDNGLLVLVECDQVQACILSQEKHKSTNSRRHEDTGRMEVIIVGLGLDGLLRSVCFDVMIVFFLVDVILV